MARAAERARLIDMLEKAGNRFGSAVARPLHPLLVAQPDALFTRGRGVVAAFVPTVEELARPGLLEARIATSRLVLPQPVIALIGLLGGDALVEDDPRRFAELVVRPESPARLLRQIRVADQRGPAEDPVRLLPARQAALTRMGAIAAAFESGQVAGEEAAGVEIILREADPDLARPADLRSYLRRRRHVDVQQDFGLDNGYLYMRSERLAVRSLYAPKLYEERPRARDRYLLQSAAFAGWLVVAPELRVRDL